MRTNKKRKRLSPLQDASLDLVNLAGVEHPSERLPLNPGIRLVGNTTMLQILMDELGLTLEQAKDEMGLA